MNFAHLRLGIKPQPRKSYADLQPTVIQTANERFATSTPVVPRIYDPPRYPLIPNAIQQHHARVVLPLKPYPLSLKSGKDPGATNPVDAKQGYGRRQKRGLAYKADGIDHTSGPLLKQAHTFYAGMNNPIPLPH